MTSQDLAEQNSQFQVLCCRLLPTTVVAGQFTSSRPAQEQSFTTGSAGLEVYDAAG